MAFRGASDLTPARGSSFYRTCNSVFRVSARRASRTCLVGRGPRRSAAARRSASEQDERCEQHDGPCSPRNTGQKAPRVRRMEYSAQVCSDQSIMQSSTPTTPQAQTGGRFRIGGSSPRALSRMVDAPNEAPTSTPRSTVRRATSIVRASESNDPACGGNATRLPPTSVARAASLRSLAQRSQNQLVPAGVADPRHLAGLMSAAEQGTYWPAATPPCRRLRSTESLPTHTKGWRSAPRTNGGRDGGLLRRRERCELRPGETAAGAEVACWPSATVSMFMAARTCEPTVLLLWWRADELRDRREKAPTARIPLLRRPGCRSGISCRFHAASSSTASMGPTGATPGR